MNVMNEPRQHRANTAPTPGPGGRVRWWRRVEWYCCHTVHPKFLSQDSLVLDLGANRGNFARQISSATGARCLAVEPSPEMIGSIDESARIRKLQLAIGGEDGQAAFNLSSHPLGSSLHAIPESERLGTIAVPVRTIPSLLAAAEEKIPDLIKMDIEGMEIAALDACPDDLLSAVKQLTIEFHDFNRQIPDAEVARVISRLNRLGFYHVRMSRVGHQDAWFINRRLCKISLLECLYIRHVIRNATGLARVIRKLLGRPIA